MHNIDLLIFDLDGTLIESKWDIQQQRVERWRAIVECVLRKNLAPAALHDVIDDCLVKPEGLHAEVIKTQRTTSKRESRQDRYIDGIDQTSFLLADEGKSKREKVYFWAEKDLMAMRMWEYKIHVKVVQYHTQWLDIDMSTKAEVGIAPWLFNLYIDPKEQYPVGHRLNAFLASMAAELKAHAATFKKYPPKNIGLGQ